MSKFDDLKKQATDKGKDFANEQVDKKQEERLKGKDGVNEHIDNAQEKFFGGDKKEEK